MNRQHRTVAMIAAFVSLAFMLATPAFAESTPAPWMAECPSTVRCIVAPAAYTANNGDVTDYGNYDIANRPNDMSIDKIVIHDTEGSLQATLDHFRDPYAYVSAHYVIDRDGTIYQMVQNKDMAWHAGNWSYNMHSIGIEHVSDGISYTPAMYQASAQLVRYLTNKYSIPRDREHVIGHDNVPGTSIAGVRAQHTDPGPFWNWQAYMLLLGAPTLPHGDINSSKVTVAPVWPLNKQVVTGCVTGDTACVPAGPQPTNFVYLRTEPRSDAPMATDPVLGQSNTEIKNNASRLFYGQTFVVSDKRVSRNGIWYQVCINGIKGWFNSPWSAPTAFPAPEGKYITPKPGLASIPVYGRPIPERSEYPADLIAVSPGSWYIPTPTPLPYTIAAGQRYSVMNASVPTDHFYAWASDGSFPYDHTVFTGSTRYIQISLGNRAGFVKASDVVVR